MCGIAGIVGPFSDKKNELDRMLDVMFHRGPDQKYDYHNHVFSMGMTRLSINDLEHGKQPFFNESKTIAVIYNGEIYNYNSLRKQLEAKGKKFVCHTDGEVIAHLYEDYGDECIGYLDGMFAVAIWDIKKERLLLARDAPGEKPLYYYKNGDNFAFASEIKALKSLPAIELDLNRQAIWDFPSFLWIPAPATVYSQIHAVPPGHTLTVKGSEVRVKAFDYKLFPDYGDLSSDIDAITVTRDIVETAIKDRLLSDVPVGSFLSGGLDSSIIATVASQNLNKLDTFTIAFDNIDDPYHGKADESEAAAETAKFIGSNHHTIHVTASDLRNSLDDFCKYGDQPFSVSSGLGILAIAKAARESGIKVLLTGDGADECFGGYSWYESMAALNVEKPQKTDEVISFQNVGIDMDERLQKIARMEPKLRAWAWHFYAHEKEKVSLFSSDWSAGLDTSLCYFDGLNEDSQAIDYIRHDKGFYFPNEMLTKVDRMTMAHSVEGRTPFAARNVQELANRISIKHMIRNGTLKWVLRQAFKDMLPMDVINRPKHGFNVPIDAWLKTVWSDLVEEAFCSGSKLYQLGIIGKNSHSAALKLLSDEKRLNGHTIFSMIMLNKWLGQ